MAIAEMMAAPQSRDRKNLIIDAAERCFVRNGFHRTTMQDVAAECAMSPGNLYRYFPSKDAIVAGLAERDRDEFNRDFVMLADVPDPAQAFIALGRRHLVEEPRTKAIMMMEIWAEACRNPRIADICSVMDKSITQRLTAFILHWRELEASRGFKADVMGSPEEAAILIIALADGLFRRRATDPGFEPASAFDLALPMIFHVVGAPLPSPIGTTI